MEAIVTELKSGVGKPNLIEDFRLVPSGGGVFEVTIDDELVFSKRQLGRHAAPSEILEMVKARLVHR